MPELTTDDLPSATLERFVDDDAAEFALTAALAGARHYCGWPVTPVVTQTVTLDGPGGQLLSLPTLNLLAVTDIDDDGAEVLPADVRVSRLGLVRKRSGACWSPHYGSITVTMEHGVTETEAADWRYAVTQLVDTMSYVVTRDPSMVREKVGEVETQWADRLISTDERLSQLFSAYRILPAP